MAAKKVTAVGKLEKRVKDLKLSLVKEDTSKDAVNERGLRKKLKRAQRKSKRLIARTASIESKARKKGSEGSAEKKEEEQS